jgi:hypothetical protein
VLDNREVPVEAEGAEEESRAFCSPREIARSYEGSEDVEKDEETKQMGKRTLEMEGAGVGKGRRC